MQAANAAVAQSNRKINGYQVSSIASTAERPTHHRTAPPSGSPPTQSSLPLAVQPQHCHPYIFCADTSVPTALQLPPLAQSIWQGPGSCTPALDSSLVCLVTTHVLFYLVATH